MQKATIQIFQQGGAEKTLNEAKAEFSKRNPRAKINNAKFSYAYPAEYHHSFGKGRFVGIDIGFTDGGGHMSFENGICGDRDCPCQPYFDRHVGATEDRFRGTP